MLLGTAPLITARFRVLPDSVSVTVLGPDETTKVVDAAAMEYDPVTQDWELQYQSETEMGAGTYTVTISAIKDGFTGLTMKRFKLQ